MIHLLTEKVTTQQVQEMLKQYSNMIKIVVDIRRLSLAGGGDMHADCEDTLLDNGSRQSDLWCANWYPAIEKIEFDSLINIRPRDGNRSIFIQNREIQQKVEAVIRQLLGGIQ